MLGQDMCRNRVTAQRSLKAITAEAEGEDPTGCGRIEGVFDALMWSSIKMTGA